MILVAVMTLIKVSVLFGIIYLVILAWPLFVAFTWYKWYKEDTPENTTQVVC